MDRTLEQYTTASSSGEFTAGDVNCCKITLEHVDSILTSLREDYRSTESTNFDIGRAFLGPLILINFTLFHPHSRPQSLIYVSVNSKPDYPPGDPRGFAHSHCPGGFAQLFCPGGRGFELEKGPVKLIKRVKIAHSFLLCQISST